MPPSAVQTIAGPPPMSWPVRATPRTLRATGSMICTEPPLSAARRLVGPHAADMPPTFEFGTTHGGAPGSRRLTRTTFHGLVASSSASQPSPETVPQGPIVLLIDSGSFGGARTESGTVAT